MSLLVYSASAGSGKTYTLALKYISLALKGQTQDESESDNGFNKKYFTHILAVTFTNKATGEMKKRILEHLYDLAYNIEDYKGKDFLRDIKRETQLDDEHIISSRAQEVIKAIVNDYDHFKVETIDSFFQTLLSELANELKLPRDFQVDLDDDYVISKAVDDLLLHLSEQGNEVVKSVESYLKNFIDEDKGWNIGSEIKKFATKELFDSKCVAYQEIIKKLKPEEIKSIRHNLIELRKKCEQKVEELISSSPMIKTIQNEGELDKNISLKYTSWINSYLRKLLVDEPSKSISKIASNELDSEEAAKWLEKKEANSATREQSLRIVQELRLIERQRPYLQSVYNSCELMVENLNAVSLLNAIEKKVTDMTTDNGSVLLSRTPILFNNIVGKDDASFVFERTGNTFNHIMIDEFQDTSLIQWSNFKKLLIDSQAQNYECMLVGDVKQSIYRWRGGDWNILAGVESGKDRELGRLVKPIEMDTNYRSAHTVVHFNNAFFLRSAALIDGYVKEGVSAADNDLPTIDCHYFDDWQDTEPTSVSTYSTFLKNEDTLAQRTDALLPIYKNVAQRCKKDEKQDAPMGYVYIETLKEEDLLTNEENGNEEESAPLDYVMSQMRRKMIDLHEEYGVAYKNMIILIRTNREGADIVNYFAKKQWTDLKLTTEEAFLFTSSDLVCSLIYALKYLNSRIKEFIPENSKPKALNEKSDNTTKDTVALQAFKHYYQKLCRSAQLDDYAYRKDAFLELLNSEEQVKQWANTPLYELCLEIATILNINKIGNAKELGQSAYFFNFMDAVVNYVNDHDSSLDSFINCWDDELFKKSIIDKNSEAIRILTIHKAKGLEAHTVFIPFASFAMQPTANKQPLVWCETHKENAFMGSDAVIEDITDSYIKTAQRLMVAPIKLSKKALCSTYKEDYEEEYFKQRVDAFNTLYVAFTRARNNLFVWSEFTRSAKDSTYYLINAFVNNQPSNYDPKELNSGVWEYGRLEKVKSKKEKKAESGNKEVTKAENEQGETKENQKYVNPFSEEDSPISIPVSLQVGDLSQVEFLQSNDAKEFVATPLDEGEEELSLQKLQEEYVERGILYHRFFSMIETEDDLPKALSTLLSEGAIDESEAEDVRKMAEQAFAKVTDLHWFDGTYKIFNECNVLTRNKQGNAIIRRPDRVMVNEQEIIVIDYKFGSKKEEYMEQVSVYINYLEQLFKRPVKGYIWHFWKASNHYYQIASAEETNYLPHTTQKNNE